VIVFSSGSHNPEGERPPGPTTSSSPQLRPKLVLRFMQTSPPSGEPAPPSRGRPSPFQHVPSSAFGQHSSAHENRHSMNATTVPSPVLMTEGMRMHG
jgi:hypothetical protein